MRFDLSPATHKFTAKDGDSLTIVQYFKKIYKIALTDVNQPLFEVEVNEGTVFIPPEVCVLGGIPEELRTNGGAMRTIMAKTRKTPAEKMQSIEEFAA